VAPFWKLYEAREEAREQDREQARVQALLILTTVIENDLDESIDHDPSKPRSLAFASDGTIFNCSKIVLVSLLSSSARSKCSEPM
jgi:hypothetical protein